MRQIRQWVSRISIGPGLRIAAAAVIFLLLGTHPVPDSLATSLQAANEAAKQEDNVRAAQAYHAAFDVARWDISLLEAAITNEMQSGDYAAVESDLQMLASRRPLHAQELAWLGTIKSSQGSIDEAIALWEQARTQGSIDTNALRELARNYEDRGDWAHAVAVLTGLSNLTPTDASLMRELGMIEALDSPDQSAISLAQAAALDSNLAEELAPLRASLADRSAQSPDLAYAKLGVLYLSLEELPLAEEALSRAVDANPVYPDALAYLAYVRARLGKPSLGPVEQAASFGPESPTVHYLAGLTWKQLGRPADARTEFERAYDLDPTNPAFCVEIASTHRAEHSLEWAETWMQEALRLAPDDPRFRLLFVQFYVDEGYRVNEVGLSLARQLAADLPDSAAAHDALAWALFQTGQVDAAQSELDQAMTLDPHLGRAFAHMGQLMEQRGEPSLALWYYLRATEYEPNGPFGALAARAVQRLGDG